VRLGYQFCVADGEAAMATLSSADFKVKFSEPMLAS
jgi:hypothetical protein